MLKVLSAGVSSGLSCRRTGADTVNELPLTQVRIERGWPTIHESGTFVRLNQAGAESVGPRKSLRRTICLLVGPSAFVLWIVTGVRSLHRLRLRYWQLVSTYVAPCSTLAAAVGLVIASASQAVAPGALNRTMAYVAALIVGVSSCWCFWYNWRRTPSGEFGGAGKNALQL